MIFGALEYGQVVGSAGLIRETRERIRHKATVWGMAVDPAHRGRGIGGELIDMAISQARYKMGIRVLQLSVEDGETPAQRLYESKGFKIWGTEPMALLTANGEYRTEHYMSLILD